MGFGKTQATKAALSLLGVQEANFVKNITDAKSFQRTSTTTLGIVIDDPTHPDEIAEKILNHFEKGTHETVSAQYTPKTTFITSVNMECLQMLSRRQRCYYYTHDCKNLQSPFYRVISRVVLLPFLDTSSKNTLSPSERDNADFQLNSAMKKASKGAGLMISLGKV